MAVTKRRKKPHDVRLYRVIIKGRFPWGSLPFACERREENILAVQVHLPDKQLEHFTFEALTPM